MLTVYDDAFAGVLGSMKRLAEALDAKRTIEDSKREVSAKIEEQLRAVERYARMEVGELPEDATDRERATFKNMKKWKLRHDATEEERAAIRSEHVAEKVDKARIRLNQQHGNPAKRHPAEVAVLAALDEMESSWWLTPKAVEHIHDAISALAQGRGRPDFPFEAKDAIRRGYRATDAETAASAVKRAAKDRKREEDERAREVARQTAERLRREKEQLEAEIAARSAPERRIKEIEKELQEVE